MTNAQMLYIFDGIDDLDEDFLCRSIPLLSRERREKSQKYRSLRDQALSVAVYLLLRRALKERYDIDIPVELEYGEHGKPYLREYADVHFSLSHCRYAAACIVSDSEVGVDVQEIRPVSDSLAKRALTTDEFSAYRASDDPSRLFCELWAAKESYLKLTGQGISAGLAALSAADIEGKRVFWHDSGYVCCVAGAGEELSRVILSNPHTLLEGLSEIEL